MSTGPPLLPPLQRPHEGDGTYGHVLELAKGARKTVGFLPDSAFADRARQGTLLAFVDGERVAGYVLYDLPRDEIRIVQLVVAPGTRGRGLARGLIDAVVAAHPDRRGVLLHCRNDFPAHRVWPKLDFIPVGERPGRSFDGKPLTRWFRSFGQPDLFTLLDEADSRPLAILDACVFFDLVAARSKPVARQLRADWIGEHVRLGVVDHVLIEIAKGTDAAERQRQRQAAEPFRLAQSPTSGWRPVYERLVAALPDAPAKDEDDLTHLAQSIAAQASWLVTTDSVFIRRYGATSADLGGPRLLAPAAFLREVDEQARGDRYQPVDLADTKVTRREVDARSLSVLADTFVNHARGEKIRELRGATYLAAARPMAAHLELIEVDGDPRGLVGWELIDGSLNVTLLRVTTGRGETTIGRHLLGLLREQALASGVEAILVVDPFPSGAVQRSFRDEGFASAPDHVIAHVLRGSGTHAELLERATALGSPVANAEMLGDNQDDLPLRAAAAERWFAPYRVVGAGISNFVVPIRSSWAAALFDVGLSEGQLFSREWALGLRRELVYYRSPANSRGLGAPARILWYTSGTGPGGGTIRAVSHLIEVAVDEYERLFHRFARLGAYRLGDVKRAADKRGRSMALRFSHTALLEHPVPLDAYRRIVSGDPKSKRVVLQSPQLIDEHAFVRILELGSVRHA